MLAKTCRDVAQQGENKGRSKELTEQANCPDFSFFPEFVPRIFPKGTSRKQTFFIFFHYFFIYFSLNKDHKRCNHKNWHLQLRCYVAYRKNNTFSEKRAKPLTIFFLYFPEFFWGFWRNQTDRRWVWVGSKWCRDAPQKISDFSDKRAKSYACFTEGMSEGTTRRRQLGQSVPKLQHRSQDQSSLWLTAVGRRQMM